MFPNEPAPQYYNAPIELEAKYDNVLKQIDKRLGV